MKFLIVLPDVNYYLWQMIVQMNNMIKFGYDSDVIFIIGRHQKWISNNLKNILEKNKTKCSFFIYGDNRINTRYSSSLRPHVLSKFFKDFPEMEKEQLFYIDPDVIFIKKINFNNLLKNDCWYLSDTRSYINSNYIKNKSEKLFEEMCKIVEIDPQIVINNDLNAGGAQYLMKNLNFDFWKKVERDSTNLYLHMLNTSKEYSPDNPIQAWTADMWAVLWNAWKFKHETKIVKSLNFCWATDPIEYWNSNNIFHNAGVVSNNNNKFFSKIDYQISPFNKNIVVSDKYCSYNYLLEIKETEKKLKNILF